MSDFLNESKPISVLTDLYEDENGCYHISGLPSEWKKHDSFLPLLHSQLHKLFNSPPSLKVSIALPR
jgi:hypothetical protein